MPFILPNVTIGPNAIIGAGSVVTRHVAEGVVVGGNPAKFIKTIEEYKKEILEEWNRLRPPNYFAAEKMLSTYSPVQIQKLKDRGRSLLVDHLKKIFSE
jgi:carbonic anhydrase/acetyltransferase-like protein (isoleucine patch superfamily)